MARRYQRSTLYQPPGTDSGAVQYGAGLADTLSAFSKRAFSFAGNVATRKGAQAGAVAGSEGQPTLRSNLTAYGRAFNDSALRTYALQVNTDVEENLGRLENEAGSDPDKFRALADGYRRGLLQNTIPEARGDAALLYQRRLAEGVVRLDGKRREEIKATNREALSQGLTTLYGSISRKVASGDPALMAEADEDDALFRSTIDSGVATGDLTPAEGMALKSEHTKRVTKLVVSSGFEAELNKDGGDPIGYIARVREQPVENLSDEEKQTVITDLFARLNRFQALQTEAVALDKAEREAKWRETERQATDLLFEGKLSNGWLETQVENDTIDPGLARTLRSELKSGAQSKWDDSRERLLVESSLLDYSEEEIRSNPRLTYDTRRELLSKRRNEVGGWQDSNPVQEANRRIDGELGIVPGTQQAVTEETGRLRARARTELYNRLSALPENERETAALDVAETVIKDVLRNKASTALPKAQKRLQELEAVDTSDMGENELAVHQQAVERARKKVTDLEKRAQK